MDLLIHQFFNFDIMSRALPLVLQGLSDDAAALRRRHPARSDRRPAVCTRIALVLAHRALGHDRRHRLLPRGAAAGAADLRLLRRCRSPASAPRRIAAVALAFFLNTSSYYGEIYRAGIESVGAANGMRRAPPGSRRSQTLTSVVLPQAVRNVLPDLVSNTVEVVKLTSIASVVALPEMLYSADMARSVTFSASPIVLAAAIYLVMLWPVVRLISRLERRMAS